jgi:hypothetical protein
MLLQHPLRAEPLGRPGAAGSFATARPGKKPPDPEFARKLRYAYRIRS